MFEAALVKGLILYPQSSVAEVPSTVSLRGFNVQRLCGAAFLPAFLWRIIIGPGYNNNESLLFDRVHFEVNPYAFFTKLKVMPFNCFDI